jgi:ATP-dependent DNA helicase MPH1
LACINPYFRVIGLTATPGSTLEAIQQVVSNLLTSRLEVKTDDDFDVKRYVHTKQIEKIEIPLSADMLAIKTQFFKTVKPLIDYIQNNGGMYRKKPEELTNGSVFTARKAYLTNPKHAPDDPTFQQLLSHFGAFLSLSDALHSLTVCIFTALSIAMYHGLKLLSDHGVKQFHTWYLKMTAKPEQAVASRLHKLLIATPEWRNLGKETELAMHAASASHPKLIKVEEIILVHFQKHDDETTRAMIFTEFRDSVGQIVQFLEKHSPLIRVCHPLDGPFIHRLSSRRVVSAHGIHRTS